jgi:hypothetical protein
LVKLTGQTDPGIRSILRGAGINFRIGARAVSTLDGYAGRNQRNGVGFAREMRENASATVLVLV